MSGFSSFRKRLAGGLADVASWGFAPPPDLARATDRFAPWKPAGGTARTKRGFTVVEIIVVSFIVAIAIGFGVQLMVRGFSAEKSIGGKVQVVHDAQIASVRLSELLHDATELFAPAVGLDDTRPFAVFASQANEMMVLYLDDKSRLVMMNRNTKEKQVLAGNVSRFRAYRRGRRLLNYHVTFKDPQSGELLDLLGGVCLRNDQN